MGRTVVDSNDERGVTEVNVEVRMVDVKLEPSIVDVAGIIKDVVRDTEVLTASDCDKYSSEEDVSTVCIRLLPTFSQFPIRLTSSNKIM